LASRPLEEVASEETLPLPSPPVEASGGDVPTAPAEDDVVAEEIAEPIVEAPPGGVGEGSDASAAPQDFAVAPADGAVEEGEVAAVAAVSDGEEERVEASAWGSSFAPETILEMGRGAAAAEVGEVCSGATCISEGEEGEGEGEGEVE
jgi:hypothetical protein